MRLNELFTTCGDITTAHGFDVNKHNLQITLIATECAEALEHVTLPRNPDIALLINKLTVWAHDLEYLRKAARDIPDQGKILNMPMFLEELADIQIRVASYVGGNGWTEQFIEALNAKIEKNKARPFKHGKGF